MVVVFAPKKKKYGNHKCNSFNNLHFTFKNVDHFLNDETRH